MSELTNNESDYRSFFPMFHGLYTVSKRVDCFNVLLKKNVFKGKKKHELLGRMTDQHLRFFRGSYDNKIKLENILTKKGIDLYFSLFNTSKSILKNYDFLPALFDLSK